MLSKLKQIFTIDVDYKSRVYGFDIMRGVGILIVLYAHGRSKMHFFPAFNDFVSVLGFWLMDLFFVLSGFLIGMILIKLYEKENRFTIRTAYDFWIRRWFRTLPNYYLVLFLTATLWSLAGKVMFLKLQFLANLFFCQTVITPPPFFMEESWTLCIEEWFYLLFPLLLLLIHALFNADSVKKQHIKRNLLIAILVFFFMSMAIRIGAYTAASNLTWIDMTRMSFFRLDTIAFGIFAAWVNYYYPMVFIKHRNSFGIAFLVCIALYFIYFYTRIMPGIRVRQPLQLFSLASVTIFLFLSGVASLCLTIYMKEIKINTTTVFSRFITLISLTSYSIYIFHRSIVAFIIDKLYTPTSNVENIVLFIIYFIGSILISILVYKYFEHPMTQLREKMKR
jgi:peptidoglycan/LPS O-acetylase OafA/YrhL